ncbi:alpha/beta fold hydrolase [Pseudonocardia sp. GCM10023141]|uniref:alpha/beta fold hydrolase n=1 Tax=Pseudonocardia sp. GCM10023141 TaxID=3252653 RepID=UPI003612B008
MPTFTSPDGLTLAFHTWGSPGELPPVVLHHGFISSGRGNWEHPGIVAVLVNAGRHVVAIDARGHGASDKPHDPSCYGEQRMADDVSALADHLDFGPFDLAGYSMGGIVAVLTAARERRVRRLVVGGIGEGVLLHGGVDRRSMTPLALAEALRADDPATITDPTARTFRRFADRTGGDRLALAAQAEAAHQDLVDLLAITAPTLVIGGDRDPFARDIEKLAAAIPDGRAQVVPGDHVTALESPEFAAGLRDFLAG